MAGGSTLICWTSDCSLAISVSGRGVGVTAVTIKGAMSMRQSAS